MTKSNTQGTLHIMVSCNGECPNIANVLLFYISHFWHGYVGCFFLPHPSTNVALLKEKGTERFTKKRIYSGKRQLQTTLS